MDLSTLLIEPLASCLGALKIRNNAVCEHLVAILPALSRRLEDDAALADLIVLCDETESAAPGLAIDLIAHLDYLLVTLDVAGVRRWILTGMRLYPDHPGKFSRYLCLDDPAATQSIHAEANGVSFGAARVMLQLYSRGFGLTDILLQAWPRQALGALPLQTAVSDGMLMFPEHYLSAEGAGKGDIYRAAVAHAVAHLRYSRRHQVVGVRKPMLIAVLSLVEDARVERLMACQYPGLQMLWNRFHIASGTAGELSFASLAARLSHALQNRHYVDPNHWVNKGRDLFEAIADRLDDAAAFVEIGNILANDLGQMRVRFNLQQYRVEPAYRDDNTLLWDFGHERDDTPHDEMLARESIQVEPDHRDAGVSMHVTLIPPEIARCWHYAEWDYRPEIDREEWVTVTEIIKPDSASFAPDVFRQRVITRQTHLETTARLLDRSVRLRRQYEGDELDLNAAIETRISLRGRLAPDPRIFQRPGRRKRSHAILLLLDLSESTNDYIGDTTTTVLDVEKRAAAIVAESVGRDRIALHGFSSNGRSDVRYTRIKDFEEPFGAGERQRLDQQHGTLSTRIGAALRHAGTCLSDELAEKKTIFLITDGEPSDIDIHDKRYLIEDARHAVNLLAARGIGVFCLTLDKRADKYVRVIFGACNYLIVDDAVALPVQVTRAFAKISAR